MLLLGLSTLNQKLSSSKRLLVEVYQNLMHLLQAKAISGSEMLFIGLYSLTVENNTFVDIKILPPFSVSDLLDYINPEQEMKERDSQKRQQRMKV